MQRHLFGYDPSAMGGGGSNPIERKLSIEDHRSRTVAACNKVECVQHCPVYTCAKKSMALWWRRPGMEAEQQPK